MLKILHSSSLVVMTVLIVAWGTATGSTRPSAAIYDHALSRSIKVIKVAKTTAKARHLTHSRKKPHYTVAGNTYTIMKSAKHYSAIGMASWYGNKFSKRRTSSGERYNMYAMTAAHKTLPIPCYARVTNLVNKRQVIVKINDRGPFNHNRIIDLSYEAAKKLGIAAKGAGLVKIDTIDIKHPPDQLLYLAQQQPKIYLQIGTYSRRAIAQKIAHQAKHYTSYPIKLATLKKYKHQYYEIKIGPLKSIAASNIIHSKLQYAGLTNSLIVIR